METLLNELRWRDRDLDKYVLLRSVQTQDPALFFQLLLQHTEEVLPYVYTPTVGEACQQYSHLPIHTWGLYLNATENFLPKLQAWPEQRVCVIVVTDGERVLGLGDLGAGGMGIAEGKILLYTCCAGLQPSACLPICLDVGTNNQQLLDDPCYKGLRQRRLTGAAYDAVVDKFVSAVKQWQPHVLVQFEDFGNTNAFRLLHKYQSELCCFNDDIQGTACITLAGLLSAIRATGKSLADQRILFLGAGEAGTGIGELVALALHKRHGMSREQGRQHCFFMDSQGLVCAARRAGLQHHKLPFAHDTPMQRTLLEAVHALRPTALVGVSTVAGAFTSEVLQAMAEYNARPIIFPLSNPTSKAECTFEQAFSATGGQVLFASGSPFPPLVHRGVRHYAIQANNAYIFPAVGHAAVLTQCSKITDEVFLVAAETLAHLTSLQELDVGLLFPRVTTIYDTSALLAAEVARYMCAAGLGRPPADFAGFQRHLLAGSRRAGTSAWEAYVRSKMYRVNQAKL